MLRLLLLALSTEFAWTYGGYDSGGGTPNTCGRPYRAGRMHKPPCNIAREGGYCKDAGENYPWHAVKRFVKENRGLMRRMYGEQPEGSLLRQELARISPEAVRERFPRQHQAMEMDNELYKDEEEDEYEDLFNDENYIKQEYELKFEGRYMRDDDVLRTKFIYSEEPTMAIKLAGLKTAAHVERPQVTTISTTSTETTTGDTSTQASTIPPINSSTTNLPLEPSQPYTENSTVASLREVEENVEQTTVFEDDDPSTTVETDKTTRFTSPILPPITTEKPKDKRTSTGNPSESKPYSSGVLFQDMEEQGTTGKVKVNYKLAGVNACPVKEEVVAPFWANNTRGEVLALLNMYPFEQYVHWEKCSFENKQMYCREGCRCEQQYRLHRLLAYDPQNECKGIFSDWFRFPSCCVCKCYGLPSEFRVTSRSPRNKEASWLDTGTDD